MKFEFSPSQRRFQSEVEAFVRSDVIPNADQFDAKEALPQCLVQQLGRRGYLGCIVPRRFGGGEIGAINYGLLNRALNKGCSSVRSLLTVHTMVCHALERWGDIDQKCRWLPRLAAGELIAAFALTEPGAGSDAAGIEMFARKKGNRYIVNGVKTWITCGQIADLFLFFAKCEDMRHAAFLVERDTPNLTIKPLRGMLGTSASMLAEITFRDCEVPTASRVGRVGFGLAAIAATALDIARYSVAWGCLGMSEACLTASMNYSNTRTQFGTTLKNHELISRLLANMIANVRATKLLCVSAGNSRERGDPQGIGETCIAKYFASRTAATVTRDAVQIQGALGCSRGSPVARFYRDAKVMQIIEGSDEMQQLLIPSFVLESY